MAGIGDIARSLDALGTVSRGLLVGVIDGVPDLDCDGLRGADLSIEQTMLPAEAIVPDPHSTDVTLIIFGTDHGLARGCSGLILPVFFPSPGSPAPRASQLDIARGLYMAVERGAGIVNVSAGQKSSTEEAGRHLEDALALCDDRRVLVVAAAGNDGCACLHVPAAVSTVLAVGAMDARGRPIDQSNWGSSYAGNGLVAPGDLDVVGADGVSARKTGTSFATAVVTAVAARLLSAARAHGYPLDAVDIRAVLLDSADACEPGAGEDCARVLAGRLNVAAAIDLLHRRGRERAPPMTSEQPRPSTRGEMIMSTAVHERTAAAAPPPFEMPMPGSRQMAGAEQSACACGGRGGSCSCGKHDKDEVEPSSLRPSPPAGKSDGERVALVTQQACSCGGGQEPQLVYAIGALWFDFGSEARYDAIVQEIKNSVAANNPPVLFGWLAEETNLRYASGITFILMQDQIPIYAIQPAGPFALDIYREMLEAMQTSLDPTGDYQRVAIPGLVSGTTRLMNGMSLPVIYPDLRGMVKWRSGELAKTAIAAAGAGNVDEAALLNFLSRVYDELRNLGLSPQERAMNFAATNAYQSAAVFDDPAAKDMELYRIRVRKSPICRPESDCWDVELIMFDAENDRRAARISRYAVDVSEVLPVTLGRTRRWSVPLASIGPSF